jgi:starch-binding outer membrane protein SusE/F
MKNTLYKIFLSLAFGLILFSACKKDETNVYYTAGTAPVLTSSVTGNDTIPLIPADSNNQAVAFTWTNPNYAFSDGISSLNVTYNLEFDSAGANFTSPNMQTVAISPGLGTSFTVFQLNNMVANGLQLATGQPHTIQARVVAVLAPYTSGSPNVIPLNSNVLSYVVSPYAPPPAIAPPPTGTLFIVGSATPQGWLNGTTTQQFTPVAGSNGLEFTITIQLTGGGEYKFIGNNNSYSYQYTVATNDDPTEVNGGEFISGSSNNILAPSGTGNYIIVVNFQTGKFTVTAQ